MEKGKEKLFDLKSIITLTLVITLEVLVVIFSFTKEILDEKLFLLFSNVTTMVITYYFSKKNQGTSEKLDKDKGSDKNG